MKFISILIVFVSIMLSRCYCQNSFVHNLIYHDFKEVSYDKCVRLLNGTHQIGCQSSNQGNVGVLYLINSSQSESNFFTNTFRKSYVPVVDARLFGRSIVKRFIASKKVQGVVVYETDDFAAGEWSPASSCPGDNLGLYNASYGEQYAHCNKGSWNQQGDGLSDEDIPFPVFYLLSKTDRDAIIKCYLDHNVDEKYPLCAVKMKSRMYGAVDSETCTRRSNWQTSLTPDVYCDPMGGLNVVSSIQELDGTHAQGIKSTIMVTAPIDSRSFMSSFTAPGSNLGTSFITLLATSQAIGKLSASQKAALLKNILFVVFDGETFDNIGSSRMLYDMARGEFPLKKNTSVNIKMENISSVVEFRQLGLTKETLYVHYDPVSYQSVYKSQIDAMVGDLNSSASLSVQRQAGNVGLSPSSLQAILRKHSLPGIVLTDYSDKFVDSRYLSRYDTLKNLGIDYNVNSTDAEVMDLLQPLAKKLTDIATMTAQMIVKQANGEKAVPTVVAAEQNITAQLLFCYFYNASCALFTESLPTNQLKSVTLPKGPLKRYASVYQGPGTLSLPTGMATYLLAKFTGETLTVDNPANCSATNKNDFVNYFYLNGPRFNSTSHSHICVRTSTFNPPAVAPALINNDFSGDVKQQYALWSESRWSKDAFKFTMFLQQDEFNQGMTLLAGCVVLIVSISFTYFLNSKATVLFRTSPAL